MIIYKSREEIETMDRCNRVVAQILAAVAGAVAPGTSTADLDRMAERMCRDAGVRPAFKGYRGYPCVLCTSVNEEVVHGIPSSKKVLREGDIIGLDFGVVLEGYYGDAAVTVPVGRVSREVDDRRLAVGPLRALDRDHRGGPDDPRGERGGAVVAQGRGDPGGSDGRRAVAQRHVPGAARQQAPGARAHFGEDAQKLYPDPHGGQGARRAVALRPVAGPDRVPVQVRRGKGRR